METEILTHETEFFVSHITSIIKSMFPKSCWVYKF